MLVNAVYAEKFVRFEIFNAETQRSRDAKNSRFSLRRFSLRLCINK